MFSDNLTQKIAEAAKKIMDEELKGGQKKIDKNHNNKIDGQDFAILRGEKKVKEEVEQVDETVGVTDYNPKSQGGTRKELLAQYSKSGDPKHAESARKAGATQSELKSARPNMNKEEVEQVEEGIISKTYDPKTKTTTVKGTYGREKSPEAGETNWDKENKMSKDMDKPAKKKGYGARQNYVRSVKESFSEMIAAYREEGLKSLLVKEEPTNDEYTAEVKAAQAKSEGKGKKAEVAKAAVQAVKTEETHTKVEVLDFNDVNGVKRSQIDLEEDAVEEAVRVYDVSKSNAGERPVTPQQRQAAATAARTARASRPTDRYTAKPVTGAGSVGAGQRQAGKPVTHIAVREEEEIDERSMTDAEMNKREKIVKSMKKGLSGFKQRYGDRAKSVMYATATKQAMKD